MGADYVSSIFRSANKIQDPELLLTSVFRTHGKRRKVVMLCFCQTRLSIALLSHYGQADVVAKVAWLCLVYHYDRRDGFHQQR